MLLCILIRWVVFDVVFRDDFSIFLQSFLVIVVRTGVTIVNPKTDSKSEFGGPKTVEERLGCAWGKNGQKAIAWWPREPHVDRIPLSTCGPHGPHVGHQQRGQFGHFDSLFFLSLKFPFPSHLFSRRKSEIPYRKSSQIFSTSKHYNFLIWTRNWVIQVGGWS